jgi:hypothetical protein
MLALMSVVDTTRKQNKISAPIRERFRLSQETYRIDGIIDGRQRIARLNDLKAHQKRRFKRPPTAIMAGWSRSIILIRILPPLHQIRNGLPISVMSGPPKANFISPSSSTFLTPRAASDRLKKDLALSALQRVLRPPKAGILHQPGLLI